MKLKKIGCGLIAVILSLPVTLPVTSYAGAFSDANGHWAEFYISKAFNDHIIEGYPNGRFQPDKAVTRAEFTSMVNKAFHLNRLDNDETVNFSDVLYSSWYYNDVITAVSSGYAGGYNDNTFKPNNPITRQEAAVMLSRLITDGKKKGNLKSFSDSKSLESWAADAMTKLNGKGYMGAYSDKKLHPADPLTRAQTAKIISEILDNEDIISRKTVVADNGTTLSAKTYVGDVRIDEDLGEGTATIDNCIILGSLIVEGGGTITLNNTRVAKAVVDKDDSTVKIVAKGSTVVGNLEASKSCYLQSSGKAGLGFPKIIAKSSSNVTLKGIYPDVTITGSRASLMLESGEITKLTVNSSGRYSDITLSGKAKVTEAEVNGECYFHGTGTITNLLANADDITYETKPDKMTVGLQADRPESEGKEDVTVTFKPKTKAEDVDVDTKITITFNTSMKLAGGKEISDSGISNFVSIHTGSKTGTAVTFTATINSAKKIITITPSAKLTEGTKYYVILEDEALENTGGNKNDGESVYFTTEGDSPTTTSPAVTTPVLSSFALSAAETSVTAGFTPNVSGTVYATASTSSGALTAAQIIAANHTVTAAANTAGSLTLTGLTANTKYYVFAVLHSSSGTDSSVVSSNITTAMSDAVLSSLTLAPSGGSSLLTGFSETVKSYSVQVPSGTAAVDVTAGFNAAANPNGVITINGTTGTSLTGIPVSAGSSTAITVVIKADNRTTSTYVINVTVAAT